MAERAVFLDRDGILVKDVDLLVTIDDIIIPTEVAPALTRLKAAGFLLVVISNQTVVSRGLLTEEGVCRLQAEIEVQLSQFGSPGLDGFYFCSHHPNATLPQYRIDCQCRKPRPGLLLQAADDLDIDLKNSFMVGDRMTDVIAGRRAGCRSVLVQSGMHTAAPIQTSEALDANIQAEHTCENLLQAANWILEAT